MHSPQRSPPAPDLGGVAHGPAVRMEPACAARQKAWRQKYYNAQYNAQMGNNGQLLYWAVWPRWQPMPPDAPPVHVPTFCTNNGSRRTARAGWGPRHSMRCGAPRAASIVVARSRQSVLASRPVKQCGAPIVRAGMPMQRRRTTLGSAVGSAPLVAQPQVQ
jgi:hypothetical protein